MARRSTATSAFGVSRREGHDATGFYRRFTAPELSADEEVAAERSIDKLIVGDARHMGEVPDASVALVVTSPPYFAGKEYEESLDGDAGPATYLEYLQLLRDVFAECARKLEPGGRMAVNVANLGRRPYRSLSADVIGILQDDLRLLLRGEIIWVKQRGSSGSCAWGSFQRPGNPVLRDLSERVIVASKGRFDRAHPAKVRAGRGLPSEGSMTRDDFMENTVDVWEIPAESATRVGHPAPFPIELPARLIDLYTYRDDLVLDPFSGSGSTAVAALRAGRHYAGYDLDPNYVETAERRIEQERRRLAIGEDRVRVTVPAASRSAPVASDADLLAAMVRDGRAAKDIARAVIESAGFSGVERDARQPGGVDVHYVARDRRGGRWYFEVAGGFTTHRSGLRRAEVVWKVLGKAAVLHDVGEGPLVVLTTGEPSPGGPGTEALRRMTGPGKPIFAVVDILDRAGVERLRELCAGEGVF
jgi:DNA modification methylase